MVMKNILFTLEDQGHEEQVYYDEEDHGHGEQVYYDLL